MKILQCVADIDPALGGSVEAARLLTAALLRQGHRVEVLTLVEPRAGWAEAWGTRVICPGPSTTYYLYNKQLPAWVRAHAAEYDVFVIHGIWRYISVGVWRGLRGLDVPYVLFTHGMLDPYYNSFEWKRLKKVLHWHLWERKVLRDAGAVLFTCEEERLLASTNFRPFLCRQEIVGLGVNRPPAPADPPNRGWPVELEGKRVALFLARIHPQKGCDTLVSAFAKVAAQHPDLHLLIAGPDEIGWQAALARQAESNGSAKQITWYGPVYGDTKWAFFRNADVYILPTNFENFGLSILEAMSCGLPVLTSRKAAIWREIVKTGAGFVSQNTVEGTAEILNRWLAVSKNERARMRENARRCFERYYDVDAVAVRLTQVLESVAAG